MNITVYISSLLQKTFLLCAFFIITICFDKGCRVYAQDPNAKFKAIYISNFTKYVNWPAATKKGDFIIGIMGESPCSAFIQELPKTLKVDGYANLVVKKITNASEAQECLLLFIGSDKSEKISDVVAKLKGSNTLIVTESDGLARRGAAINFVLMDNKIKFELNKSNATKYGIEVSSKLEPLAIKVD